jgi:cell division protein FtsW
VSGRTTVRVDAPGAEVAERRARSRHPTARPDQRVTESAPAHFWLIVLAVGLLVLLGLVMVLSSTSVMALNNGDPTWYYFQRQAVGAVLGTAAFGVMLNVDYHRWRRLAGPALVASFGLMVFTSLAGDVRNGARAWLEFGPVSFQPAELLKLTLLLYCADLLARRADRMQEVRSTFWPLLVWLGMAGVLIMIQNDLGSAVVVAAIVFAVAFLAGTPLVPFATTIGMFGAVALAFTMSTPYRRARIDAFLHPDLYMQSWGFQVRQSLVGIASGGLFGVGVGASKAKWGFLPEAHTDFIFAIIAEELGFAGAAFVCALFVMLALCGARVALRSDDRFGMLLAGGITAWLSVQALINIGGATHVIPLTGLTLPFVSFGSSSLMVTMAAAGVLANVARRTS